jgi:regulator of cell morphogenesis and NO signaling
MQTQIMKTVRDIALETSTAPAVLESLGIDYCCGGHIRFEEACNKSGKAPEAVVAELEKAAQQEATRTAAGPDWTTQGLSELIAHICRTHHAYIRNESPRLLQLARKVATKHAPKHPGLTQVETVVQALTEELSSHLMKEEQILFPYIEKLEQPATTGAAATPRSCFGSVSNPIHMMMLEHDSAGDALRELRRLTNNYELPAEACMSYRGLFEGLLRFEADLHQHIHLENNILFPRAVELERSK